MKLSEAMAIIEAKTEYLVHFEHIDSGMLRGDYFPDVMGGEAAFKTEDGAIAVGEDFARATKGKTCNFYIVRADNFRPTGSWNIKNR
ncbi:MAG: hypothetical protein V3R25_10120 [Nitrosomonadaceae bacterium]